MMAFVSPLESWWTRCFIALLLLLLSSSYLLYYAISYPPATSTPTTRWHLDLRTDGAPAPAISICNQNDLRVLHFTRQDLDHVGDLYFGLKPGNHSLSPEVKERLSAEAVAYIEAVWRSGEAEQDGDGGGFDPGEFVRRVGHQRADMIRLCTWGGQPCESSRWTHHLAYPFGNCFTYNPPPLDSSGRGPRIIFSAELDERNEFARPGEPGAVVQLHAPGDVPYFHVPYGEQFHRVRVGDVMFLGVQKVVHIHGPQPRREPMNRCSLACEGRRFLAELGCVYYDHEQSGPGVPLCKNSRYTDQAAKDIIYDCRSECEAAVGEGERMVYEYRPERLGGGKAYLRERNMSIMYLQPAQSPVLYEVWRQVPGSPSNTATVLVWCASVVFTTLLTLLLSTQCSQQKKTKGNSTFI